MSTKILVTILLAGILAGCSKDADSSKPILKITSVNTNVVPLNGVLVFQFDFTDKEGDISDTMFVRKTRINKRIVPTIRDSFRLRIPDAPNKSKGIIEIDLGYQNFLISGNAPGTPENDTLLFKFNLRDKAKNVSDTVTSNAIVILRK